MGDDASDKEADILEKSREFVASLEGVSTATFVGQFTGSHNLLSPAEDSE
jgi:hypothetical protein